MPVGVIVCVCVARAEPVKVSAGIVIEGEEEAATALFKVENTYFVALLTETSVEAEVIEVDALVPEGVPPLVALVVSELPVNTGAATVPEGVPALTALVVSLPPVNTCAAAVSVATVGADSVPAGV